MEIDQMESKMVKRRMESFDSGVSFRTDQAENILNLIRHRFFPMLNSSSSEEKYGLPDLFGFSDNLMTLRRPCFSPRPMFTSCNLILSLPRSNPSYQPTLPPSDKLHAGYEWMNYSFSEKSHVVADDEDWVKSPYSLMAKGSMESIDSGVPCQSRRLRSLTSRSDFSSSKKKHTLPDLFGYSDDLMALTRKRSSHSGVSHQDKRLSSLLRGLDLPSSEEKHVVADDEDWIRSPYSLMAWGSMESLESNDSGVSFKTDQSKDGLIDFKDGSSPRSDFSSSEEEDVVSDDEDFFESSDDLGRDDPGVSGLKWDGNIIEAPVSSCF